MNGQQYKIEFPGNQTPELKKIDWDKYLDDKSEEFAEEERIQQTLNRESWEKEAKNLEQQSPEGRGADIQAETPKEMIDEDDEFSGLSDNSAEYARYKKIKIEQDEQKAKERKKNDEEARWRKSYNRYLAR